MRTKFYLDKRTTPKALVPDTGGIEPTFPVKVAINHGGSSAYLSTGVSVKESEWLSKPSPGQVVNHPRKEALNIKLAERKLEIDKTIEMLRLKGELKGASASEIKAKVEKRLFYGVEGEDRVEYPLTECFARFTASKARKERTIKVYEETLKKIQSFDGYKDGMTFASVTPSWLSAFNSWLERTSPSANARGVYLRSIRAVFNFALAEELTSAPYPFRRFKIRTEPTPDRSLTPEELQRLWAAPCNRETEKYRDLFFLSFFLCGMNLEDILEAGKPKNGRVEKRRIKTGQPLTIRIETEAQAIIDKYKGKDKLLDVLGGCRNYGNYLHRVNNALKRIGQTYNPHTKEWEGEAVVPCLSFYYARYSWATIAAGLDIPERTVGAAMGHGTARSVTSIYMRVDMRKKIDEANRKVIDFCFGDLESSEK